MFTAKILKKLKRNFSRYCGYPTNELIPKTYIKKFLPKNPVIVEAGANNGLDTVDMSTIWPHGTIHAFEPVPHLFDQLVKNTEKSKNVKLYRLALSQRTGLSTMHISSGASDGSSSLLLPKEHLLDHPTVYFSSTLEVPSITLDEWAKMQGIHQVDFIWLDIQGLEYDALKASPRILRTVRVLYTEVSLKEAYEGGALYTKLKGFLENQGFVVAHEALPWADMGNVLFIRKQFFKR